MNKEQREFLFTDINKTIQNMRQIKTQNRILTSKIRQIEIYSGYAINSILNALDRDKLEITEKKQNSTYFEFTCKCKTKYKISYEIPQFEIDKIKETTDIKPNFKLYCPICENLNPFSIDANKVYKIEKI